jgi:hypothetical protein
VKTCPQCSAENKSDAWLCSCGYEFIGSEPQFPSPPKPVPRFDQFPLFTVASVLTFVSAVVAYLQTKSQIARFDFGAVVFTLALAFLGFASLLFCLRILLSPDLAWGAKLFSILFIVLGVFLLGCSVMFGGCSAGVFRFRMNN